MRAGFHLVSDEEALRHLLEDESQSLVNEGRFPLFLKLKVGVERTLQVAIPR